jgi:hypothetical protein
MRYIFIASLVCAVLLVPSVLFAQQGSLASVYGEALENQMAQGLVTCQGLNCDFCALAAMINRIINWLIGFLVVVAVLVFVAAGFKLVTSAGNTEAATWAKQRFAYVFIGLLLVLASWLIIDTILRGLTGQGMTIWGSFDVTECGSMATPQAQRFPEYGSDQLTSIVPGSGLGDFVGDRGDVGGDRLSDAEARALLAARGISARDSVSYEGLQPHVVDRIAALNQACNCNVLVTSATDGTSHAQGTYSHYEGYKLDLRTRDNPALLNYVQNNFTPAGSWSNGTPLYRQGNTICAIESTHMDCQFLP